MRSRRQPSSDVPAMLQRITELALEARELDERLSARRAELRDVIRQASEAGISHVTIGECAGLSKQRIGRIVAS